MTDHDAVICGRRANPGDTGSCPDCQHPLGVHAEQGCAICELHRRVPAGRLSRMLLGRLSRLLMKNPGRQP